MANDSRPSPSIDSLAVYFVLSAVALAITVYFNIEAINGGPDNPYFRHSQIELSEKYKTDITPAGFTFGVMWSLIYLFQIAWVIYALTTLFRNNSKGPIYLNPIVMPANFHAYYIIGCIGNIGFLFAFDRENIEFASLFILLTTVSGYKCLATNCKLILENKEEMQEIEPKDLITDYVLVQNGLDLYFSWTLVAFGVSMATVFQYSKEYAFFLSPEVAATIVLIGLYCIWIVVYTLDITILFQPYRYVYSRYLVGLWALIGILVENYDIANPNTLIEFVGLGITLLFFVAKLVWEFKGPNQIPYHKMQNEKM